MNALPLRLLSVLILAMIAGASAQSADPPQPAPVTDLIFSHPLHVTDQGIECVVCHSAIPSSTAANDRNLPSMDVCAGCHDVEGDGTCSQCHRDPENITPSPASKLSVMFSHKRHIDLKTPCATCHEPSANIIRELPEPIIPGKPSCMACHDDVRARSDCSLCHTARTTLDDIHPIGWRHNHAEQATVKPDWCRTCHGQEAFCIGCHRGDNQTGSIHDLNYEFTHGLDAQGKESDCSRCHDRRVFCNDCHERENRMPLAHSSAAWRTDHGRAARADIENCASCHQVDDPTCARTGCHLDADGVRGTDQRIHSADPGSFDTHGPWHGDGSYFCFTCHIDTGRPGVGFCGYCHGDGD